MIPYNHKRATAASTTKGRTTAKSSRGRGSYDSDESYTDDTTARNEVTLASQTELLVLLLLSLLLALLRVQLLVICA
jgi:hypothetical protein